MFFESFQFLRSSVDGLVRILSKDNRRRSENMIENNNQIDLKL